MLSTGMLTTGMLPTGMQATCMLTISMLLTCMLTICILSRKLSKMFQQKCFRSSDKHASLAKGFCEKVSTTFMTFDQFTVVRI